MFFFLQFLTIFTFTPFFLTSLIWRKCINFFLRTKKNVLQKNSGQFFTFFAWKLTQCWKQGSIQSSISLLVSLLLVTRYWSWSYLSLIIYSLLEIKANEKFKELSTLLNWSRNLNFICIRPFVRKVTVRN